jgi:hypothetical protein
MFLGELGRITHILKLWQPFEYPEESYMTSHAISGKRSPATRRQGRCGKT